MRPLLFAAAKRAMITSGACRGHRCLGRDLWRYEAGRLSFSIGMLDKLADLFDMGIERLMGRSRWASRQQRRSSWSASGLSMGRASTP